MAGIDDAFAVGADNCDIGETFNAAVRCAVFAVCGATLVLKQFVVNSDFSLRRPWFDFALDLSKQFIGTFFAQIFWGSSLCEGGPVGDCGEKWMRIVVGTSVGTVIELLVLTVLVSVSTGACNDASDLTTGDYRDSTGAFFPAKYGKQLSAWLVCVTMACWLREVLMTDAHTGFLTISHTVLQLFSWNTDFKIAFVTFLTPCCLGCVQAWVTDDFLCFGGLPESQAVVTLASKFWSSHAPSFAEQPASLNLCRSPLLAVANQADAPNCSGPSPNMAWTGSVSGRPFWANTNGSVAVDSFPAPPLADRRIDGSDIPGLQAPRGQVTPAFTTAVAEVHSPAFVSGFGEKGEQLHEHPITEPPYQHTDLQQAIEGMETQIARALGCVPATVLESDAAAALGTSTLLEETHTTARDGNRLGSLRTDEAPQDSPELQELRARIGEKDKFLERLRNEIARTEEKTLAGSNAAECSPIKQNSNIPIDTSSRLRSGFSASSDVEPVYVGRLEERFEEAKRALRSDNSWEPRASPDRWFKTWGGTSEPSLSSDEPPKWRPQTLSPPQAYSSPAWMSPPVSSMHTFIPRQTGLSPPLHEHLSHQPHHAAQSSPRQQQAARDAGQIDGRIAALEAKIHRLRGSNGT